MEWKRMARLFSPPVKSLERASWWGAICWLAVLGVGLWLLNWLEPQVAQQTYHHRPMSLFEITALLTMVAASFLGSYLLGLLISLRGNTRRLCRAIAGASAALPVGLHVTQRLSETGLDYNYGPAIVGALFCGLAAVLLYPDPFAEPEGDEKSSVQANR